MDSSILSFPDRGPWGNSSYRGNCSGHVYRELFQALKPSSFCDPMMGSGTSVEVAEQLGIKAYGLDLRFGFNAVSDSILAAIGDPVDLTLSHPPYGAMIRYSGSCWGTEKHPDDLSWCESEEAFHEKLQMVLLNQREATLAGGHYGTIIGDRRYDGRYVSYQAEAIARMPSDELVAVLIKCQHNVQSSRKAYAAMRLPRIAHEYVLIWQKRQRQTFELLKCLAVQAGGRLRDTWRAIVHMCLVQLGGHASLVDIYEAVRAAADERCASNRHWQAKVRQILNQSRDWFEPTDRGVWKLKRSGAVPGGKDLHAA